MDRASALILFLLLLISLLNCYSFLDVAETTTSSLSEALQGYGPVDMSKWGPPVRNVEAPYVTPKLLTSEEKAKICLKYNLDKSGEPLLKAPALNKKLQDGLAKSCVARDTSLREKQKLLGHALMAIGQVLSTVLKGAKNTKQVRVAVEDAAKLVADVHASETESRRQLLIALLRQKFTKDIPPGYYLFGDTKDAVAPGAVETVAYLITCAAGCIVGPSLQGVALGQQGNGTRHCTNKALGYLCRKPCNSNAGAQFRRAPVWCVKGECTPPYRGLRARWRPSTPWTGKPRQKLQDGSVYTDTNSSEETSDSRVWGKKEYYYY